MALVCLEMERIIWYPQKYKCINIYTAVASNVVTLLSHKRSGFVAVGEIQC